MEGSKCAWVLDSEGGEGTRHLCGFGWGPRLRGNFSPQISSHLEIGFLWKSTLNHLEMLK